MDEFSSSVLTTRSAVCVQIAKETRDSLWLAIVGLTDMLLHQRLDHDQYVSMATSLEIEVRSPHLSADSVE